MHRKKIYAKFQKVYILEKNREDYGFCNIGIDKYKVQGHGIPAQHGLRDGNNISEIQSLSDRFIRIELGFNLN